MADNVTLNSMTGGSVVGADEVTDGTLGTVKVQYVKIMDGTLDGTGKAGVDSTFGLKTLAPSGATLASTAVSVTTSATQLLAASSTRRSVGIYNNGTQIVYVGASGVTTSAGFPVSAGGSLFLDKAAAAAVYAISASGTQNVRVIAESD